MAIPVENRLKKKKDFDEVFKKGKAVNGSFLFIKSLNTKSTKPRFGFIVASKFVANAVTRNKIKRLLADSLWPALLPKIEPCDNVVVMTKKPPEDLDLIRDDFLSVLKKSGRI